jgi:hypothetical protein
MLSCVTRRVMSKGITLCVGVTAVERRGRSKDTICANAAYSERETMKQTILQEKYPVFVLELPKSETDCKSADEIIARLKADIDAHKVARFIAEFDHYSHTKELPEGQISPDILDAKNIVFCFGIALPNGEVLAVRPRSIGVAEFEDKFMISFLEAPMPVANMAMESWVRALRRHLNAA